MANNITKLIKRYGKPVAGSDFETKNLVLWDVPKYINKMLPCLPNKIYCNKDIVEPLNGVFLDLIHAYMAGSLSVLDSLVTWDGCFNIRPKRGYENEADEETLSTHAFAISVDVNAFRNQLGKEPTFSRRFVKIWENHGFIWGGYFKRKDGMHFEYNTALLD